MAAATGLHDGLRHLFEEEHEAMYRLVVAMLGSEIDAEEVVQDAFVAVPTRWKSLESPGGYLRVSVVNGARKKMRSSSRRQRAESRLQSEGTTSAESSSGEYLFDVLDRLPDRLLRAGQPTVLRTFDESVGMLATWRASGIEEECTAGWEVGNEAISEAAAEYGVKVARFYDEFNGVEHDEDAYEKGYIAEDRRHASGEGIVALAAVLHDLGYEPIVP